MTPFGVQPSLNSKFFPKPRIKNIARTLLAPPAPPPAPEPAPQPTIARTYPRPPMAAAVSMVCALYGITPDLLRSHRRTAFLVNARVYAVFRLVALGHSDSAIARFLNRDHTSIWHLRHKHEGARG